MAKYYEAETLIEFVNQYSPNINGETTLECVERAIRNAPTAEVIPRSEVIAKIATTKQEAIACNHEKTIKFVNSGYDMGILTR